MNEGLLRRVKLGTNDDLDHSIREVAVAVSKRNICDEYEP